MSVIVEFHNGDAPEAGMVEVQDAELVVICHPRALYTVWKDREGDGRSRVSWSDLTPRVRKMLVEEVRR